MDNEIDLRMSTVTESLRQGARTEPEIEISSSDLDLATVATLMDQGFPQGLAEALRGTTKASPVRYWLVDNSGSMRASDGQRIVGIKEKIQEVKCTRWKELQGAVEYHAELSGLLEATTNFIFINDPMTDDRLKMGFSEMAVSNPEEADKLKDAIQRADPYGPTPLDRHLDDLYDRISSIAPKFVASGQQAVLVLATDGLPSDARGNTDSLVKYNFLNSLKKLQTLPVWIVVRLCTDNESIVEYYNELDKQLEAPLEVIDDLWSEGKEIHLVNKWLTYALPLHRCREMGYHNRLFDILDERELTKDELVVFLRLLFGKGRMNEAPDIHKDWSGYKTYLEQVVHDMGRVYSPLKKKLDYWIDMKALERIYGNKKGGIWGRFGRR